MNGLSLPLHRPPSGRGKLILLMLGLFAVPVLVTALLFAVGWRPAKPAHHGELVATRAATDDVRLPLDGLQSADSNPIPAETLGGRWTLAVASPGDCGARCEAQLDSIRRIHVALYKQMPRVRRMLLTGAADSPSTGRLRAATPDLIVATPATAPWQALLAEPASAGSPNVFVIDPAGRVVMRYSGNFEPAGMLHDVERLLKYSWIG